jgi:hypothetical protein
VNVEPGATSFSSQVTHATSPTATTVSLVMMN